MKVRCLLLLTLFLGFCHPLLAQDSIPQVTVPVALDTTEHQPSYLDEGHYDRVAYMGDLPLQDSTAYGQLLSKYSSEAFDYDKVNPDEVNIFERALTRIQRWLSSLLPATSLFAVSDVVYKILAGIALIVFLFILYKVLFSGKRLLAPSDEAEDSADSLKFIEKNLLAVDLQAFIDKAQTAQDYALAIRYLNLLNIQLLANKKHILWRPSKTNQELILEIRDPQLKADFEQHVAIFNRVWFSGMQMDAVRYTDYAASFLQFQSRWK